MAGKFYGRACCLFFLLSVIFVGGAPAGERAQYADRLVRVNEATIGGVILDDADRNSLLQALARSKAYLQRRPDAGRAEFLPKPILLRTLEELEGIIRGKLSKAEMAKEIRDRFDLYAIERDGDAGRILVTGYYEPEFEGSLQKEEPYLYPLYGVPDDLVVPVSGKSANKRFWRRQDNLLYSYWRRRDIEEKRMLANDALVYLADPVEAFLLHVQGSGRVRLADGAVRKIRYAANNGLAYRSIGKLLVERGVMPLEKVSMPRIVAYLRQHPEERQEILNYNDRYIFFRWEEGEAGGDDEGPVGSMGETLTAGRSVALDREYYPPGVVGLLQTRQPRFDRHGRLFSWVSMKRFVFSQDTGGAIKGPGRLDMFFGSGPFAEQAAGVMRQEGTFWVLIKKDEMLGANWRGGKQGL